MKDYKKYFSGFKSLWKTKKALSDFLENEDLELWYEILSYYRPKVHWKKRGKTPTKAKITWKDIADRVFSEYVRLFYADLKWKCKCVTCWIVDHWFNLQAWHYKSRDWLKYRFDIENVYPQCYRCNVVLNWNYRSYKVFMDQEVWCKKENTIRNDKESIKIYQWEYMEKIVYWYGFIKISKKELTFL